MEQRRRLAQRLAEAADARVRVRELADQRRAHREEGDLQDAADRLAAGVYVSGAGWTGLGGATAPPLVDARGSGLAAVSDPVKGVRVLHQDPTGSLALWAADTPAEKWANGTITVL